jgi:hypothetical protein
MPDRFPPAKQGGTLSFQEQRRKLAAFVKALGADQAALMRGADLNWHISGERGDVRPLPQGYEVFLARAEPAEWSEAKARLRMLVLKENYCSGLIWVAHCPIETRPQRLLTCSG